MAIPKADDLKIVVDENDAVPTVYSNHQGLGRTALEFSILFNRIRIPVQGIPGDKTLHALPLVEIVMPHQAALGLLEAMAEQLGRKVEPIEQEQSASKASPKRTRK